MLRFLKTFYSFNLPKHIIIRWAFFFSPACCGWGSSIREELKEHFIAGMCWGRNLNSGSWDSWALNHYTILLSGKLSFSHEASRFNMLNFNLEFSICILKWDWLQSMILCMRAIKGRLAHKIIKKLFRFSFALGIV